MLPFGWTPEYALKFCVEQIASQKERIKILESEVERLDREKAAKRGRKPKATAQP